MTRQQISDEMDWLDLMESARGWSTAIARERESLRLKLLALDSDEAAVSKRLQEAGNLRLWQEFQAKQVESAA